MKLLSFRDLGRKEFWIHFAVISIVVLVAKTPVVRFLLNKLPSQTPVFLVEFISLFGLIAVTEILSRMVLEV